MGLDAVELLLEVEETFGFSIPDEDAATLDTVGKLYDYIMAHRFGDRAPGCLTSVAFYRLRRALMSVFGLSRSDVRPALKLVTIIPRSRRRRWAELQEVLGLRLPELVRPAWVTALATALGFTLIIATAIYLALMIGQGAVLLTLVVACAVIYVLGLATRPLAIGFRSDFATVGGLSKSILQKNIGSISDASQRANADEVWNTLRKLIAEQLGMRIEDVTKQASFGKDLNVG